jgi:threonine dehydrogenase-like Zn-dependent dehydrogenase
MSPAMTPFSWLTWRRPLVGDQVVVLCLGTVGLLVTAMLSRFPLETVMGIDPHRIRGDAAAEFGASDLLSGEEADLAVKREAGLSSSRQLSTP